MRFRFNIEQGPSTKREVILDADTREAAETAIFQNYPGALITGYAAWNPEPTNTEGEEPTDDE